MAEAMSDHLDRLAAWVTRDTVDRPLRDRLPVSHIGAPLNRSDLRAALDELKQLRARTREEIERRSYAVTHAKVCEEKCDKAHAELERLRAREQQYRAWLDGLGYDALWVDARFAAAAQQPEDGGTAPMGQEGC